ncbi:transposable element Tcb2 transposase [Trichonephila clavipes]|uniref:Transposable element Tcb2 transposase n=1 Tax=Trichonephila clavipes TaxID=2585209 RepID=A0A8X6VGF4_TRICX|nr:transposable element Tcb2 transposase [Trichonephila clavipes]
MRPLTSEELTHAEQCLVRRIQVRELSEDFKKLERSEPLSNNSKLTPTHQRLCLELCRGRGNCTAAEWNQVIYSDQSRFNLSNDDNRVCVWRPCGERLNPAFALQRNTAPTAGVMVWVAIA